MKKNPAYLLAAGILVFAGLACNLPTLLPPATPSPTPEPTATFTPEPTPTPVPTPTPEPLGFQPEDFGSLVSDEAFFVWVDHPAYQNGDWQTAIRAYQEQAANPSSLAQAGGLYGLGKTYLQMDQNSDALGYFRRIVDSYADTPYLPLAYFQIGEIFMKLQRYRDAAEAYSKYLELRPGVIDYYVLEKKGDALLSAGDALGAFEAFLAAQVAPQQGDSTVVRIKAALALSANGDQESALALLTEIYDGTTNGYVKAEVNWRRAQIHLLLREDGYAHIHLLDSIQNYPYSYYSYLGLIELVEAGVPVNEYDRGLVDYYANQMGVAVAAFDRYLQSTPQHLSAAHYYKGLALRSLNYPEAAINEFDELIAHHTIDEKFFSEAWQEKGYTQWAWLDQYASAIQTFLDFATLFPGHSRAPEFIFYAAQVSERNGQLEEAATLWSQLADNYPSYSNAFRAKFLAGITYFRLQKWEFALSMFNRAFNIATDPADLAAATVWIGKTQFAMGDQTGAQASWATATGIDPTGYYSERANQLAIGKTPFSPPEIVDLVIDLPAEQKLAENWLKSQFLIPAEISLSGAGPLVTDGRFIRGTELWGLGQLRQAQMEFESLRKALASDPAGSYRLVNHLLALGLYRTAIQTARQILDLAGMDDAGTLAAPPFFNLVRFGPYYLDIVLEEATRNDLNPLLIFSQMRQESLFESFASSSAGARGLMQIMPTTGQGIYNKLRWPENYSDNDLLRPVVSIRFGTSYLADQVRAFNGQIYPALAAYNAGPGNAQVWYNLAGNDPDLFLEIIRFAETRTYIRSIFELFEIYAWLYDRTP